MAPMWGRGSHHYLRSRILPSCDPSTLVGGIEPLFHVVAPRIWLRRRGLRSCEVESSVGMTVRSGWFLRSRMEGTLVGEGLSGIGSL
jgi:hypothetical protein